MSILFGSTKPQHDFEVRQFIEFKVIATTSIQEIDCSYFFSKEKFSTNINRFFYEVIYEKNGKFCSVDNYVENNFEITYPMHTTTASK